MQSRFLAHFEKLKDKFQLNGNRILVEILPKEELMTPGGLILQADMKGYKTQTEDARPVIALILKTGDSCHEDYSVGKVAWITKHPTIISEFPGIGTTDNKLAVITDDTSDIHVLWQSLEQYEEYKRLARG